MDEKEGEARPLMGTIFLVYICFYSILHILTIVFPDMRTAEYQPIFHGVTYLFFAC